MRIDDLKGAIRGGKVRITDHADEEATADRLALGEIFSSVLEGELVDRLEGQEARVMKLFEKCPICGGDLAEKSVEKLLRGGNHTAVVTVEAEVCLHCGERLYSQETVRRFEEIRAKLVYRL